MKSIIRCWMCVGVLIGMIGMGPGCAKDPSEGVVKAQVENAPATVNPTPATVNPTPATVKPTLNVQPIVPIHLSGSITFTGSKVTGSHTCKLGNAQGLLGIMGNDLSGASLRFSASTREMVCDAKSRNKWTPDLEKHLRGEDFFWTDKFPNASFVSTAIEETGKHKGGTHSVKGQLTLRGVTKTITFPATIEVEKAQVKGHAQFSINRKDFGIAYAGKADDLIRDNVVLEVSMAGKR